MSGFLERLALRGAGLARPGSPAAMRLRPRGRFEPGPGFSAPAEEPVGAEPAGPSPWSGPARLDIANGPASLPGRTAEPSLQWPASAEPAPPLPGSRRDLTSVPPVDIAVAEEAAAERALDAPPPARADRPGDARLEPVAAPEPERAAAAEDRALSEAAATEPGRDGPPAARPVQRRSDRPEAKAPHATAPAAAPPALPVQWRPERPEAGEHRGTAPAAPLALRSPPGPPSAPVALSIGRIDVEFANPPAPPVAAPQAASRTRGFASYSRIRRGSPR